MIVFKKIKYKNLLSTGNQFIEINLNDTKMTLMIGSNGAGKSSWLDALSFVLFGKAFRKINKPQLINSITKKNMVVEIEFSVGGNNYKVIRGMKPNIFEIYKDGSLLNQTAEEVDYQAILEKQILKVNHKSFCQVVILGSANYQPFMELALAQRRAIIEDLLDLQIFTTMNSLLKDKQMVVNENINDNQVKKKLLEEKLKLIKEHILEQQLNNQQFIKEKEDQINDTVKILDKMKVSQAELINKVTELELSIEHEKSVKSKINQMNTLRHKIEAKLSVLKKDIEFFEKHDDCPTCKQAIDVKFKTEIIETKQSEIDNITDGLQQLSDQYTELDNQIKQIMDVNKKINDLKLDIYNNSVQSQNYLNYIEIINKEIDKAKNKIVVSKETKISELDEEAKNNRLKYAKLQDEKSLLGAASILLKDSGIKAKIIKQYIPIINKFINKYLAAMEFMCEFQLNEEFNEIIKSRYRDEFSYESFSEGEKDRITLAILFTWRAIAKLRNTINTNILILDEVFDSSTDANGVESLMKIFTSTLENTNVFIISHKDQMVDKFSNVIKFSKVRNFSRIVEN